jgi:3'(2'), 5'-bisphosphate nucleotidase
MSRDDAHIIQVMEQLALQAGRRIMDFFRDGTVVETKPDASPVTEADRDAEAIILDGLRSAFPDIPVVAEEEMSAGDSPGDIGDIFFLVDPLDGTREFVDHHDDFTVNIALVREGEPTVGVVYAPARGLLYSGRPGLAEEVLVSAEFEPSARRPISVRSGDKCRTVLASRSHRTPETDAYIAEYGDVELVSVGSSLKFCMLASGKADLYPRLGRTMQWDTAAGDAVLRAAGGRVLTLDGKPFRYGRGTSEADSPYANPYFIAEGRFTKG